MNAPDRHDHLPGLLPVILGYLAGAALLLLGRALRTGAEAIEAADLGGEV